MEDGKYSCPIETCGRTGFKTAGGVRVHLSRFHKIPKEQHPHIVEPPAEKREPAVNLEREDPPQEAAPTPVEPTIEKIAPEPDVNPEPEREPELPAVEATSFADQDPPEMEPPLPSPEVTPPPAVTPPAPSPEVTVGTAILLNGTVWWQHPGTKSWVGELCSDLTVQVLSKEISENGVDVMLICRAQGGQALWSVNERDVLDGKIKIVKAAPVTPTISSDARPADGPRNVSDPEYDYFAEQEQARAEEEATQKAREEYGAALQRYVDARDRKSAAAKAYKQVDDEVRPQMYAYITEYGEPSEAGKDDLEVIDFDTLARITTTPGETIVKRDTEVIVQWLKDNDMEDCLRQVLDIPAWEKAKEEGKVPAEFVRDVEKPEKQPDSKMFTVTKL